MAKKKPTKSAVIQLLETVYHNSLASTGHSWERLNHAMSGTLAIAIGSGIEFAAGDWKHIVSNFRSVQWLGDDTERWYSRCVAEGNKSAIEDYERFKEREPIIADDVTPIEAKYAHMTGARQRERLHVGSQFEWQGYRVTVTSFATDGKSVVACAYEGRVEHKTTKTEDKWIASLKKSGWSIWHNGDQPSGKPIKRFTITREAIIADRVERKRRDEITQALFAARDAHQVDGETLRQFLKASTATELKRVPLKLLEKAMAKYCSVAT